MKYFTAIVNRDILKEDIQTNGDMPDIIPQGYITWFIEDYNLNNIKNNKYAVHPENNRWQANIPFDYFTILETDLDVQPKSDFERFMKQYNAIPQYVECVKIDKAIELGKIYKVLIEKGTKYSNIEESVYYLENFTSPYYQSYFNPSNKEAYDAQNKPINEFKAGDYIVILELKYGNNPHWGCARTNYCFKQRADSYYIKPVIDLSDSYTNGNSVITFNKQKDLLNWRYATSEEIAEYDRLGKPYDVTTINEAKYDTTPDFVEVKQLYYAVEIDNEEEFKFIRSKNSDKIDYNYECKTEVIYLDAYSWSTLSYYNNKQSNNYKLITFKQWCDMNNYTFFELNKCSLNSLPKEYNVEVSTTEELNYVLQSYYNTKIKRHTHFHYANCKQSFIEGNSYSDAAYNDIIPISCINLPTLTYEEWYNLINESNPVEPEFKVGELAWVSSMPKGGNGMDLKGADDGVYELLEINETLYPTGHLDEDSHFMFKFENGYLQTNKANIRKATESELAEYHKRNISKESFKIGDWVIITSWYYDKSIQLGQLAKIVETLPYGKYKLELTVRLPKYPNEPSWWFNIGEFRHATKDEIEAYISEEYDKHYIKFLNRGKTLHELHGFKVEPIITTKFNLINKINTINF